MQRLRGQFRWGRSSVQASALGAGMVSRAASTNPGQVPGVLCSSHGHRILECLARRPFVFRGGTNWCMPHLRWLKERRTPQCRGAATRSSHGKEVYSAVQRPSSPAGESSKCERSELPKLAGLVQRTLYNPRSELDRRGDPRTQSRLMRPGLERQRKGRQVGDLGRAGTRGASS